MARAGHFRDPVTFERESQTIGDYGERSGSWAASPGGSVWGDLLETPGREALAAGRLEATKTATLRVRASAVMRSIKAGDRVTARGLTWNILSLPAEIGRQGRVLEFKLTTGDAST